MQNVPITHNPPRQRVKAWMGIVVLLLNVALFVSIGLVYRAYVKNSEHTLFQENLNSVNSLNAASAIAAYTYTNDMSNKINDSVSYITAKNLTLTETIAYLSDSNTNPNRQLQLVMCGSYGSMGEIRFGDYSGISIRKIRNGDGSLTTLTQNISYSSGYYDILRSFTDIKDGNNFTPEFTNPDTKKKCFATYRHIDLIDSAGKKNLYAIMLVVNSQMALNACNVQNKYAGQSTVLINQDGTYLIKNTDYRNSNFYDYIVNYNGLTLDWKSQLQKKASAAKNEYESFVDLFYKNHKGDDCVFSMVKIENGWFSVTCVPFSSFNRDNGKINFSLIILLLFLALFILDSIIVYVIGSEMRYNTMLAESATKAANKANLAKSVFLSTMSHELRTPLNAIIGFVSLSKNILDNPQRLKDYLDKITISSKLLLQLISDILDISAIESNKMKIKKVEFDIKKQITELSAIFYNQCSSKGIDFNVILRNIHSETLIGDAVRVNQVLLNFLSNAVKFTPSGGTVTFTVDAVQRNDDSVVLRFTIADTGCGISNELKTRLFKPFERAAEEKTLKHSGTGLGLSIAKNVTELMGGFVGMESVEGSGSSFWAEIPFVTAEKMKQHSYSPITGLRVIAAITSDDERDYFGQMFSNFGISYCLAGTAEDAIVQIAEEADNGQPFHLCILDWKLPDLNAQDAASKIRCLFDADSLKIAILAYDVTLAKARCLTAGISFIIPKPVFSSSLYNFLQEVVSNTVDSVPENTNRYDLNGKRVLLVEDLMLNIEVAQQILEDFNLVVEVALNGMECCESFAASSAGYFSAILMDIQMPIMDGYEAARAIRSSSHPDAKTIPILAMTADAFSEDVEKAREAGMNEHISKPIETDSLYRTLRHYISAAAGSV